MSNPLITKSRKDRRPPARPDERCVMAPPPRAVIERPLALDARSPQIRAHSECHQRESPQNKFQSAGRENERPACKRDDAGYRIKPHLERPLNIRAIAADQGDRDHLRHELHQHLDHDQRGDQVRKIQQAGESGRNPDECHGKVGKILGAMQPPEHREKAAIHRGRVRDARISQAAQRITKRTW